MRDLKIMFEAVDNKQLYIRTIIFERDTDDRDKDYAWVVFDIIEWEVHDYYHQMKLARFIKERIDDATWTDSQIIIGETHWMPFHMTDVFLRHEIKRAWDANR